MNKTKAVPVGIIGVILIIVCIVGIFPMVEEMRWGVVKYPLPKSDVDCSNCQLVRTVFPQSTLHIPYQSANERDWENNFMYIVPVDEKHEFWIKKIAIKEWEEEGDGIYYLSCKQPDVGNRRLSYLFVFEEGGIRRTISESYVVKDTWIEGREVKEGNHTEPQKLYAQITETNPTTVWCMLHDCGYYDCGENDPMRHYWSEFLDDEFGGNVERIVVEAYTKNCSAHTTCDVEVVYHYVSFDCVKVVFGVRNETNYNSLLDCFAENEVKYNEG